MKNLPVGPTTKKVPPVVTGETSSKGTRSTAAALRPEQLTSSNKNLSISAAEVSRNDAPKKPFFLDPLLN
ncbi:hypothetical protein [Jiella flava]|uniref:Uncharacterized protein n=1 Tax=Jiella flava TaxID=2816857 RepID=A0A939G2Q1_9HYPH|nr:hypothetical protein [Jiella flava]MBO0664468.1 hypothetical protein [Jiella flava]